MADSTRPTGARPAAASPEERPPGRATIRRPSDATSASGRPVAATEEAARAQLQSAQDAKIEALTGRVTVLEKEVEILRLKNVLEGHGMIFYFLSKKTTLTPNFKGAIDKIVRLLREKTCFGLIIEGHTNTHIWKDAEEEAEESLARAGAVKAAIISANQELQTKRDLAHVPVKDRLLLRAVGSNERVDSGKSAFNRRVILRVEAFPFSQEAIAYSENREPAHPEAERKGAAAAGPAAAPRTVPQRPGRLPNGTPGQFQMGSPVNEERLEEHE